MKTIVLCNRPDGSCCPKVDIDEAGDNVRIYDDDTGEEINMTLEQYETLKKS